VTESVSVETADLAAEAAVSVQEPSFLASVLSSTATWILIVDVLLVLIFGAFSINHSFWSVAAMQVVALDSATTLILACGIALLLGAGEIDLSVGAGLLLASVYGGKVIISLAGHTGTLVAALAALAACLGVGALVGLFNSFVVTQLGVTSLIATLATLGIATGIANIATNGTDLTGIPVSLQDDVGIRQVGSIPLPALMALVVWGVMWFVFRATRFGMRMLALGSSRSAAERSGMRVNAHLVTAFVMVGALAGFAGFVDLTRFATTNLAGHQTDALAAITACVIGGTSLFGGRVSIAGVLTGTLLAVILQDGLVVVGLSSYYQLIAIGAVLIAAVFLDNRRSSGDSLLRLVRKQPTKEGA
jgi:ribose transport system permease protein